MNSPKSLGPYVRCPFCPDRMHRSLYERHLAQLHVVDMTTGRKVPYAPPLGYDPSTRKKAPADRKDIPGQIKLLP